MRPKTVKGRATRERIVEAAARLMHVRGVAATSVEDVLAEAVAGKGQFYHYFGGKAELVRAVLRHQMDLALAREAALLERLDSWTGIRAWFDAIIGAHEARGFAGGCPVGSLAAEAAESDEELRRDLVRALDDMGRGLREGLAAMKRRGALVRGADPDALGRFTVAAIQGGLLLAATRREREPLATTLDATFGHLRSYASRGAGAGSEA